MNMNIDEEALLTELAYIGPRQAFIVADRGVLYFRVFGWGLWFATYEHHPPLFSERHGYVRTRQLNKRWRVQVLKPRA